jgi:UDP-N-acetylmuramoylalanine--D-glutamate ligase
MIDIKNKNRILVLGAGKSGIEAAKLLQNLKKNVYIYDKNFLQESKIELTCKKLNIDVTDNIDGVLEKLKLKEFDLVVTSPGMPKEHILHLTATENNILVISEIELAYHFCKRPIIAITGSNAKSTTTKLITDIINHSDKKAVACANYGTPLSAFVLKDKQPDYYIAEVSSFQLEWIYDFKPKIAILLNIKADHLDRHKTIQEYADAKKMLFKNMNEDDLAIAFEPALNEFGNLNTGAEVCTFSDSKENTSAFCYDNGNIKYDDKIIISLDDTMFQNKILSLIAIPAYIAANFIDISDDIIQNTIQSFKPLPHRTQFVRKHLDRTFIDDSKSTNVASLEAALLIFGREKNIILVAGGILKEKKLQYIKDLLEKFVKKIYLIGNDGKIMLKAWEKIVPCEYSETLEKATKDAFKDSKKGDIILLSPACASFDQFSGYKERGKVFQEIANSF